MNTKTNIAGISPAILEILKEFAQDWNRYAVLDYSNLKKSIRDSVENRIENIQDQWGIDAVGEDTAILTGNPVLAINHYLTRLGKAKSSQYGVTRHMLGFLSPDGVFYQNPSWAGHQGTCEELCKALRICPTELYDAQAILVDELGWVKFEWYDAFHKPVDTADETIERKFTREFSGSSISWLKNLTKAQQRFLLGLVHTIREQGGTINNRIEAAILEGKDA